MAAESRRVGRRITKKTKVLMGGLILLLALGYAGYSAYKSMVGVFYRTVGELQAMGDSFNGDVVRVGGPVVAGSIQWDRRQSLIRFRMADEKNIQQTLAVSYKGEVPDTFRPGAIVIVVGKYAKVEEAIDAYILMAKCPHKWLPL